MLPLYNQVVALSVFEFLELHEYSVPSHPCDQEPDRQMKPFPRLERPEFAAGSGAVLMLQGVFDHTALVAPGQKETSPPKFSGHRWPQVKLNGNVNIEPTVE
jgi:hypothetical protein